MALKRYLLTEHTSSIIGGWDLEDSDWEDRLLSKLKPASPWGEKRKMNEKIKKRNEGGRGQTIHNMLFWEHPV